MHVLYVLGVGAAAPDTVIDSDLLKRLNPSLDIGAVEGDLGIKTRRSALPRSYLEGSAPHAPREAFKANVKTPTDLAYEAARAALDAAGIASEQLGLIVGDCPTPVETCPSEGQRLGSRLGIKVPAYDLIAAGGAFVAHLATMSRWKEDRCPEFMLGMTSAVVTHAIDYSQGIAGALFGDGAAAYLVSARHRGKLKLIDGAFTAEPRHSRDVRIERYGSLRIPASYVAEFVRPQIRATLASLKDRYGALFGTAKFIGAQCDPAGSARSAIEAGFAEANLLDVGSTHGDMLGAGAPAVIAQAWNTLRKGERLFVVQSGLGIASGFLVFEVTE